MKQMKKLFVSALIAVVVAGSASAQDGQPRREGFGRHHYGNMQQLNLTDEQKTEMKTINDDFKKQMSELQKNEDITVREWKSKMKNIREDHQKKVQQVLTDEQKAKMEKLRQDRKGKMHKKGQHNIDSLKKDLNLSAEQAAALKQQRTDMMQKLKAIKEDKSLTDEQKKAEMKKFREQQHQSLKSILSEEQINKLQQHKSHGRKPVL
jgi:Spy/CpxP family protein refolding chaperone